MNGALESERPKVSPLYDPKVRSIAYQVVLCASIAFLVYSAVNNAIENLARAKIAVRIRLLGRRSPASISARR